MRFPTSLSSALMALCLLISMTSCVSKAERKMTPEQSREVFITEAKAIIRTIFPTADPRVVIQVTDAPCGGPAGTDHSSVESMINVHGDAPSDNLDPDQVFAQVVEVLRQRNWQINYTRSHVVGAERKGVGGIRTGVGGSPLGINISGDTECVKNPDA